MDINDNNSLSYTFQNIEEYCHVEVAFCRLDSKKEFMSDKKSKVQELERADATENMKADSIFTTNN